MGPFLVKIILIVLITIGFALNAQDLKWAKSIGGASSELATAIAKDSLDNIYITGSFGSTVDFDPGSGTANLTSAGSSDIFIAKYDVNGNYVWAKGMGGTGFEIGNSIGLDSVGNIYITGNFKGTADFDPNLGTANLISTTSYNIFVAKYDNSGNYLWAKSTNGIKDSEGKSVAVD